MLKLPQSMIYAVIAVNISGFTFLLQMDLLTINSLTAKIIAWTLTIAAWALTYINRKKTFTLF